MDLSIINKIYFFFSKFDNFNEHFIKSFNMIKVLLTFIQKIMTKIVINQNIDNCGKWNDYAT